MSPAVKNFRVTIFDDEQASYEDDYERSVSARLENDELTLDTVDRLRSWVERNEAGVERDDLELLGRYLYRLLFTGEIGEEFEKSYRVFTRDREATEGLRLRLWLLFHQEASVLASYPWEFIYMPQKTGGGYFLAAREELALTRFVPELDAFKEMEPSSRPLRLLVAYCHPKELDQIDVAHIMETFKTLQNDGIEVGEILENCTVDELKGAIKRRKPHVLHFIGHGEEGRIALMKSPEEMEEDFELHEDRREARWCDTETVKTFFADHRPRLVFLHACKTAAGYAESLRAFTSTARELVYSEIPAVIGMQFEIESQDAANFADVFYREIAAGEDLDTAVAAGRRRLGEDPRRGAWADRRFGTPLVYLQTYKPVVLSPPPPKDTDGGDEPVMVPCPWGCRTWVTPSFRECPTCNKPLTKCPNGHAVAARPGRCPICQADVGVTALAPAGEASAQGAATPTSGGGEVTVG